MKKQAYKKVYVWDGCCTQARGEQKVLRRKDSEQSKPKNSAKGQKGEENGQSGEQSKAEMKGEQKPLARANKFRE